ncbi:winged helix-turn-helix domain-containing protein [Halobacterium yunchengense]|uniref:winged helix-turn-helix domain-containing protein n=1 Tax=Halobacterium yunchengense TaxID=3108497 RepID=UPI003009239F
MRDDRSPAPRTFGSLPPAAALQLLGSEVRAEILWALSEARGEDGPPALSFSELRARVDADMDSSQFNYHLQELVGQFVERRGESGAAESQLVEGMAGDHGEGYALRPEGTTLTRTVRAMSVAGDAEIEPFDVGLECHVCGGAVEAAYANAIFSVQCPDCEYLYDYNLTPPGVVDGDGDVVLSRVARYNRHVRAAFADGVCPYCAHDVTTTFADAAETAYPGREHREVFVHRACEHCGNRDNLTVGEAVLTDPDLVSFCRERGVDVTSTPIWELAFAATDHATTVLSRDPWRVAVEVALEGDALELVVDESLSVVERTYS